VTTGELDHYSGKVLTTLGRWRASELFDWYRPILAPRMQRRRPASRAPHPGTTWPLVKVSRPSE